MHYKLPTIYAGYMVDSLLKNLTQEKLSGVWKMACAPNQSAENRVMELVGSNMHSGHHVKLETGTYV